MARFKRTVLYQEHKKLKAKLVPFAGWEMPIEYEGILREHQTVRHGMGLFDVSHMGEIEIKGQNALNFCQKMTTNNVATLKPGKVQYSLLLNEQGGIIDDLTLYCLNENHYMMVVNASKRDEVLSWLKLHGQEWQNLEITDRSDHFALLALQGKVSESFLGKILKRDLSTVLFYEFTWAQLLDTAILISRTGYTGEDGFELYMPSNLASKVWNLLLEEGKSAGIKPIGLGARDLLRLEMGYLLSGQDFNEQSNPLALGLGFVVKFDKGTFIGKGAIQNTQGLKKKLRALVMMDRGIPRSHHEVFFNQDKVGEVTSGSFSPSLKKGIALAMLDVDLKIGQEVGVLLRPGQQALAKICKTPFVAGSIKK